MDDNSESVVDVEEQPQVEEQETPEVETPEDEESTETEEPQDDDSDDVEVSFGDTPPPPAADEKQEKESSAIREMRKANRELLRQVRELEAKQAPKVEELGPEPTMAEHDFDEEKFKAAYAGWMEKKSKREQGEQEKRKAAEARQQEIQAKVQVYAAGRETLRKTKADHDDVEAEVKGELNQVQQHVLLDVAEKPELLVYAIGKDPDRLKKLASIQDPVRFAAEVARLEGKLTVTAKKPPPKPARTISGNARGSGAVDNTTERLTEKAQKSGDVTDLVNALRAKKGK